MGLELFRLKSDWLYKKHSILLRGVTGRRLKASANFSYIHLAVDFKKFCSLACSKPLVSLCEAADDPVEGLAGLHCGVRLRLIHTVIAADVYLRTLAVDHVLQDLAF